MKAKNNITRDRLIKLIEKHTYSNNNKINKVGLITLKKLKNKRLKITLFSHHFPSTVQTRQRTNYYSNIGYCYDACTIAFNDEYDYSDKLLEITCVHEINHVINYDLYNSDKITFAYNEFLAKVAEFMYEHNCVTLTKKDINLIKKNIFIEYDSYKQFINKKSMAKINKHNVGKLY